MITLFHAPQSRSSGIVWLLEEIGEPYAMKLVNIRRSDGSGHVDVGNPHPHKKVPAIDHDGVVVFERAAICAYLTDAFPKAHLGPTVGDPRRGEYLSWLAYYAGVMEPAFVTRTTKLEIPRSAIGWVPADEVIENVTKKLGQGGTRGGYILGDTFTAADVLIGGSMAFFRTIGTFKPNEVINAYCDRLVARPAYLRSLEKDKG